MSLPRQPRCSVVVFGVLLGLRLVRSWPAGVGSPASPGGAQLPRTPLARWRVGLRSAHPAADGAGPAPPPPPPPPPPCRMENDLPSPTSGAAQGLACGASLCIWACSGCGLPGACTVIGLIGIRLFCRARRGCLVPWRKTSVAPVSGGHRASDALKRAKTAVKYPPQTYFTTRCFI